MTEENFRLFFEAAPHPYLLLYPDDAFTIAGVNERYLAATGTQRVAIVGRGLFEVFPDNPGDPKATGVSDLRSSLERVKRERVADIMGVQKYDIPSAGAGGSFAVKYWSPVNTPAFAADGSLCFIIHHVEDVTEFILSRERAVRESVESMGLVQARADRMEAEVLLRAGEVKEANRQIKAAMEELARREAELARLNEQLKELDQAKTAFFSNISHEFRTPLTLILGSLREVLDDGAATLSADQTPRIEAAQRNSLRLLKLANTLLEFTRHEAGRTQAAFQPVDLASATVQSASLFESAFAEAGLTLTVDCKPLREPVYADPEMWDKIVLNLLSNAFKFTHSGGVSLSLQGDAREARFTVCDTGNGIPEQELPNLFQRFHRIEGSVARSYEGSGIGLALVKELVELHGGAISVESTEGRGSSFHVSIPFGKSHLPPERIRETPAPADFGGRAEAYVTEALSWLPNSQAASHDKESPDGEGAHIATAGAMRPRVVLADDNADMRDYVGRLLSRAGFEVITASEGKRRLLPASPIHRTSC